MRNIVGDARETTRVEQLTHMAGGATRTWTSRTRWTAPSKGTGYEYTVYRREIDWDLKVGDLTNLQRAQQGGAPFVMKNGAPEQVQLHHSRQNAKGPLFELARDTHLDRTNAQGRKAVHPYSPAKHPDFPVDRKAFNIDAEQYWMDRAKEARP
jgi:hypothetical protein